MTVLNLCGQLIGQPSNHYLKTDRISLRSIDDLHENKLAVNAMLKKIADFDITRMLQIFLSIPPFTETMNLSCRCIDEVP